jgi:hypothetical protein
MPVFRRILVPTDFPGGRRVAIDYAAEGIGVDGAGRT